jgi:thioredoxin-related protein
MNKVLVIIGLILSMQTYSVLTRADHGPYDPSRDSFKDFELAQKQAEEENKLILIQIGGNWCSWCIKMERFFDKSPTVKALRDETFVVMKVNVSPENYNEEFLSEMPEFEGYPFLVITDKSGNVLNSRTSGNLEEGLGYSVSKFTEYFEYWKKTELSTNP